MKIQGKPDWLTVGGIVNNKREAGYLKHGRLVRLDHHSLGQQCGGVEWFKCYRPPAYSWVPVFDLEMS